MATYKFAMNLLTIMKLSDQEKRKMLRIKEDTTIWTSVMRFAQCEKAQTNLEYALIISTVATVLLISVAIFGNNVAQ
jgi:Flp pilus assembly pilin Flp